jgi:hypothetical protein
VIDRKEEKKIYKIDFSRNEYVTRFPDVLDWKDPTILEQKPFFSSFL